MLLVRRLPGIVYNNRCASATIFLILVIVVYYLFHWRLICTNIEPWKHVNNLCWQYQNHMVVGDFCKPLCIDKKISYFSCQTFHAGKHIVFSAVKDNDAKVVFKRVHREDEQILVSWTDSNGVSHYPSEDEFEQLIISHVSNRLDIVIANDHAKLIGHFSFDSHVTQTSQQRHQEMQEIWSLLQDNEYLMSVVFADKEVFPRMLGSCGQYFAVEYLNPVLEEQFYNMMSNELDKKNWAARVHLSVLILELLEELDSILPDGISLCDVKPAHFGLSSSSGKIKFLDLDVAYPKTVTNNITADGRTCNQNSDCHLFDCRSKCNMQSKQCDQPVTNNNLQVVCEKIFLGWTLQGSVLLPGLLLTSHTPSTLASLLRQCSDPDVEGTDRVYPTPSLHVKERLVATLTEIDRILTIDSYN